VFRDERILLIRREGDGLWALLGGLVEVGETLAEAAQRELLEEANVKGEVARLLGIWDSRLNGGRTKAQMYFAVFLIEPEPGEPEAGPDTTGARFFSERELPDLSPGHQITVPMVFRLQRGEIAVPYFDVPERTQG
jgi:ADP-ribose pyrophosphatase YjhB (NUDIX family)